MARTPELPSQRVEADLRRRIDAGEWARGDKLPGLHDLAAEYKCSTRTVNKAIRRLAEDGLVEIIANWGTFRR